MEDNYNISDEERLLNRLIRASQKEPSDGFTRPDGDTVMAYLLGTATARQKKAIRKALLKSPTFRREMKDMVKAIETMDDAAIQAAVDEDEDDTTIPDIKILLKRYPDLSTVQAVSPSLWQRFKELLIPRVYVPAVVTAVIVAGLIFIPSALRGPELVQMVLLEKPTDRGYLSSFELRKAIAPATSDAFKDQKEAAMAGFRLLGNYENGEFKLYSDLQRSEPTTSTQAISIQLMDSLGTIIQKFKVQVPKKGFKSDKPITTWILTLPDRNLYRADIESDDIMIIWNEDMGRQGCITLTYYNGDGYRAILGYPFELR
jgi:hypothetical protein